MQDKHKETSASLREPQEARKENTLSQIDLLSYCRQFLRTLKHTWLLIPLLAALFAGLGVFRTVRSYSPQYEAKAIFSLLVNSDTTSDVSYSNSYYSTAAAEQLTLAFPYVIRSDAMQQVICSALGVNTINGQITAQAIEDTNLFSITVRSHSAQDAYDILCAVIEHYPQVATSVLGRTELQLMKEPSLPTQPYNVLNWQQAALKWGAVGLLGALALIFLLSLARRTINQTSDINLVLGQHCLGALPLVPRQRAKKLENLLTIENPQIGAPFEESVRSIRLRVEQRLGKLKNPVFLVTSALPNEGKSTVAINLALSLAQSGKSVILVDADLRNPSIKKDMKLTAPSVGLAQAVEQSLAPEDILVETEIENLMLIAGDDSTSKAIDLMGSVSMHRFISRLRSLADYVILDTPPCGLMADSLAIARWTDGCVFVVRQDVASRSYLLDSLQALGSSGGKVIGCVLNGATGSASGAGYSYGYGYGYGYGHSYSKGYSSYGAGKKKRGSPSASSSGKRVKTDR